MLCQDLHINLDVRKEKGKKRRELVSNPHVSPFFFFLFSSKKLLPAGLKRRTTAWRLMFQLLARS